MNRTRATIVSLAFATAAVAGVFAVGHSVTLGASSRSTSDAQIVRRTAQLDRYEASLRKALARTPPPLPAVPNTVSQPTTLQSAAPATVVFHRPPPIVVVKHRAGGEQETEIEEGGADD